MKKILLSLLLLIGVFVQATNYYISPTGDDTNDGTIVTPYFTLNKAWSVCARGDTIFVRGGTYTRTTTDNLTNKSGIVIRNYQNEVPVFSYSTLVSTANKTAIHIRNADTITLQGIKLTLLSQQVGGAIHYGIRLYDAVNYSTFRNLEISYIGGAGFVIAGNSSNNLIINCDSHHNSDAYTADPWGEGDGFQSSGTGNNNTLQYSRAWYNSDDGFDFRLYNGLLTLDSCWAFLNGYIPGTTTTAGNGEGFKLGPKGLAPTTTDTLRIVTKCIAAGNRTSGFQCLIAGYYGMAVTLFNNSAYQNGVAVGGRGYRFVDADMIVTLNNNLDYANGNIPSIVETNIVANNSWNTDGLVIDSLDFRSRDIALLATSRNSDYTLPNTNFLKLYEDSDLIDKGIDVGLAYVGLLPDIGAYEFSAEIPTVIIDNPLNVTSRTLKIFAATLDDGGGTLTYHGLCWNTTGNPTTANSKIQLSSTVTSFYNYINNLQPSTTYYMKAYAINEVGTAYSSQITFTTNASSIFMYKGTPIIRYNKFFKH